MSGKLLPMKPGMDRKAGNRDADALVTSSLAEFIAYTGRRPTGAIVLWVDEDGEQRLSWCNVSPGDLALAAAFLSNEALGK